MMLLLAADINQNQSWTLPAPVAAYASSATSDALPLPWSLDSFAPLFQSSSADASAAIESSPVTLRWRAIGTTSSTAFDEAEPDRNSPESIPEYFFFDDEPSSLFGAQGTAARVGPLGYWCATKCGGKNVFAVTGLRANEIAQSLAEITDGWMGQGSIAPPLSVRADVHAVVCSLWQIAREPEVEVDEDGSVALLWEDEARSFALTFVGNGKVTGSLSPLTAEYPPWSVVTDEHQALFEYVSRPSVASLLT